MCCISLFSALHTFQLNSIPLFPSFFIYFFYFLQFLLSSSVSLLSVVFNYVLCCGSEVILMQYFVKICFHTRDIPKQMGITRRLSSFWEYVNTAIALWCGTKQLTQDRLTEVFSVRFHSDPEAFKWKQSQHNKENSYPRYILLDNRCPKIVF